MALRAAMAMSRATEVDKKRVEADDESLISAGQFPWLGCTAAVFLLVLLRTTRWGVESVRVDRPPDEPILNISLWNAPLSFVLPDEWTYWPYGLFAAAAAITITAIARPLHDRVRAIFLVPAIAGLALSLRPEHLLPLAWVAIAANVLCGRGDGRSSAMWGVAIFVGAVLTTIDFTFVAVCVTGLLLVDRRLAGSLSVAPRDRVPKRVEKEKNAKQKTASTAAPAKDFFLKRAVVALAMAAGLSIVLVLFPEFCRAAFRPVLWIWRLDFQDLLPSLSSPFSSGQPIVGHAASIFATTAFVLGSATNRRPNAWMHAIPLGLIAAIGFVCSHFVVLTAAVTTILAAASSGPSSFASVAGFQNKPKKWLIAVWLIAAVHAGIAFDQNGLEVVVGGYSDGRVDVDDWEARGTVCLVNLDHTRHWTKPQLRKKFRLLLTDRFDAPHEGLADYQLICQDLVNWKRELYLRTDGSPGGFSPRLIAENVELIVFDTSDWLAIRRMSVDPKWRLLAIDGARSIFGRTDRPTTRRQAVQAANLLFHLEWPRRQFDDAIDGTIALGTPAENARIATALAAIRLPYAGLKILSWQAGNGAETARAWCYVELAHRAIRQTGQASLLDHPIAINSLAAIADAAPENSQRHIEAVRSRQALVDDGLQTTVLAMPNEEHEIRTAVRSGQIEQALQLVGDRIQDVNTAHYYSVFLDRPRGEFSNRQFDSGRLREIVAGDLRDDLRAEGLFYLGCRSLEVGDAEQARLDLVASQKLGAGFALAPLRDLYLQQLFE